MGTRNKHLFRRLGLLFIAGVLFTSSLVTLIKPESVSAKKLSAMTLEEEAASATYYTAMSWCVLNTMGSSIATELGKSGETTPKKDGSWFQWNFTYSGQDKAVVYSHVGKAIARDQSCENVAVLALDLWGWTDYKQFLRDMEYRFDDNPSSPRWVRDKGAGQSLVERMWSQVQSKVYEKQFSIDISGKKGWGAPMSAPAEWMLMSTVFNTTCSGKLLGLYPNGIKDSSQRKLVEQNGSTGSGGDQVNYRHLNWFEDNTNNVAEYGISYKTLSGSTTVYGWLGDGLGMTCEKIAEKISSLSLLVGLYAGEQACKTAGVLEAFPEQGEEDTLNGCADGFIHKTPFDYCLTMYPARDNAAVNERRKACYFGQGNEAGEACRLIGFTSEKEFNACIYGSKNKSQNCTTKYTTASPGSGATYVSQDEVDACKYGQTITISQTEIKPSIVGSPSCSTNSTATGCEEADTSCAVAGIGWIVCPVINFMAELGDSAYTVLTDQFLTTDTRLIAADDTNGTYIAWGLIRSIANVAFVIVFLVIIFSQLTGAGVSNYGVKKMLPRLVIGVILVNLSFVVCQLAVDISNILGGSINGLFESVATQVNSSYDRDDPIGSVTGDANSLLGVFGIILSVGVVGVGGYFLLSAGGTLLLAALAGLLITLLILIIRQVIIILAIVIAPLVFVAWILPNTENLFKQWVKIFSGMLLVFPIVALIFGGATLASAVIGSVAVSSNDMLWQLIAALLPAVALIAVIPVLQGAIKAVPVLGQFASKMASRANGTLSKRANESVKNSVIGRGMAIRKAGRENYRTKKFAERIAKGGASRFFAQGIAVTKEGQAAQKSVLQSALATEQKARIEEVNAAKAVIEHANLSGTERQALALGKTVVKNGQSYKGGDLQKAAIDMQMQTGSYDEVHSIVSQSGSSLLEHSQRIQQGLIANGWGTKSPAFAGKNLDKIAQGGITSEADMDTAMLSAISEGRYTAEALASMNNDARQRVIDAAKASSDPNHLAALKQAAAQVVSTPELQGKVAGNTQAVQHIYTDLA